MQTANVNDGFLIKNHKKLRVNLWKIAAIIIAAIFFMPIAIVVSSLFFPNLEIWQHLYQTTLAQYLVNTFLLAIGVGFCSVVIGVSTAWLVTMCEFPGATFFKYALILPMAFPAYIVAYTYTGIFDVSGPFQHWIRVSYDVSYGEYWFPEIRSLEGAILVMSLVLYPYVYLLTRNALLEQSICVYEVARSLGCGGLKTFLKVVLPLIRPAVMVGLSLVLMETLADYGTVQYFGVVTFTTGIFRTWFGLDSSLGAIQLSAMLLSFVIILILVEQLSRKQAKYYHTSNRYSEIRPLKMNGPLAIFCSVYCLIIIFMGFLLPLYFLIQWSLLTYKEILDEEFIGLVWNSLKLSLITAVCAILISTFIAYGKRRYRGVVMPFILKLLSYGYAIPGVIIATGVMVPMIWLDKKIISIAEKLLGLDIGLLLSGSIFILIFAYLVRFLAISLNTMDNSLEKIKPSIDEAGMSLGLNALAIIRRIHLPMIKGGVLTAFIMIFVDVLKELPATLILRPFNFNTLAIRAYELANEERLIDAATASLAIVAVGLIPVFLLSLSISQSRPGKNASSRH